MRAVLGGAVEQRWVRYMLELFHWAIPECRGQQRMLAMSTRQVPTISGLRVMRAMRQLRQRSGAAGLHRGQSRLLHALLARQFYQRIRLQHVRPRQVPRRARQDGVPSMPSRDFVENTVLPRLRRWELQ